MRIISLGWGTQSTALAVMAALGDIEPVDFAIHADTTHERTATYEYAKMFTPWLEDRGVKVLTVTGDNLPVEIMPNGKTRTGLPCFMFTNSGKGQLSRNCTNNWKIAPMRRAISAELKAHGFKKTPGIVKQLLGISMDEYQRMRDSDVKYITNEYPLIDKHMNRHDCKRYIKDAGLPIPARSSCMFCPYQRKSEWRELRNNSKKDWRRAVEVDAEVRKARPPYDLFICDQIKPLPECDLSTPQDHGQMEFDLCDSGYCFV